MTKDVCYFCGAVSFADCTARSVIGYWNDNVICLSIHLLMMRILQWI